MRHEKYRKNKRNRTYTGGEKTMKLTMLGTGNALVTECYNTCFVLSDEYGKSRR